MIIRRLSEKDIDEHNKTSSSAFIWPITPDDNTLGTSLMYGAFTDDGTTGMAQAECANFSVFYGRDRLGCAGIGGVATRPEFRGNGCISAIFRKIEEDAAENGFDISILYPFSTAFYNRLGYANLGYKNSLKAEFSAFKNVKINTSVILYEGENSDRLYNLYNSFAENTDLMFYRNDDRYFFKQPYTDNNYTYIWLKNGEYRSYASFTVNRATNTLEVSEIGYCDNEALYGIIGFLRVYEGNIKYIWFKKLPVNSPVLNFIDNTSHIERQLYDLGSARIHNISKVLHSHIYPEETGSFSFFADDIVPAHKCIYDVEYSGGQARISQRSSGSFDLSLDSCAMAKFFLSGTAGCFDDIGFIPGVKINNKNPDFLRAFPARNVFFYNGF